MGYSFSIKGYFTVPKGVYDWPCASAPDRKINLYADNVLTRDKETGTYMKHTGLGCFGIVIPDGVATFHEETANLRIM